MAFSGGASGGGNDYGRFHSEGARSEEQLKSQTIGLVHLDDFRKRRAEAFEDSSVSSRSPTPGQQQQQNGDGSGANVRFKKRKVPRKGGLSFAADDDEDGDGHGTNGTTASGTPLAQPLSSKAASRPPSTATATATPTESPDNSTVPISKKRLAANTSVAAPKAQTKSALLREAQLRETLRREFLGMQERVRATPFLIPFVFYDGVDAPGGACRMVKGDQVWRFLDKARKVGAANANAAGLGSGDGAGGGGGGTTMMMKGVKTWARVSVDDLMLVRGDLILPHHYEFYYFMLNNTRGFENRPLFAHSAEPTAATPEKLESAAPETVGGLSMPGQQSQQQNSSNNGAKMKLFADSELEGSGDDPGLVKVVDRRWYERNKHIFPQSMWQDFDPEKDYSSDVRKDAQGNAYFAGR